MDEWTKFIRTDGQTSDDISVVTLRRLAIAFNSHFIRANRLQDCSRVAICCNAQRYRVGFKFHSDQSDQNSFALTADGGSPGSKSGDNRAVQVNALMKQHLWLSVTARSPNPLARRYHTTWNAPQGLWAINVRPSFENRVTSSKDIESGLCGIYRYWAGDQVVYIGRGDIRSRSKSPERADWVIDMIEYSVVEDNAEQEKWEALWLDEHRNQYGTLPLYNRIGGKRAE